MYKYKQNKYKQNMGWWAVIEIIQIRFYCYIYYFFQCYVFFIIITC